MDYCNSEYCGDEPWPGGPVKDLPDIGIYGAPNAYFLFYRNTPQLCCGDKGHTYPI